MVETKEKLYCSIRYSLWRLRGTTLGPPLFTDSKGFRQKPKCLILCREKSRPEVSIAIVEGNFIFFTPGVAAENYKVSVTDPGWF